MKRTFHTNKILPFSARSRVGSSRKGLQVLDGMECLLQSYKSGHILPLVFRKSQLDSNKRAEQSFLPPSSCCGTWLVDRSLLTVCHYM